MKQLVIRLVMVLLVLSMIAVSVVEAGSLAGNWNINCNNFTGKMAIRGNDGGYSGKLFLQGKWEDMLDLTVTGNRINFRRATANQRYGGIINGKTMSGFFNQGGQGKYSWKAHRNEAR